MIDIIKLEKLSCLKLTDDIKLSLADSISGVTDMMKDLDSIDMPILNNKEIVNSPLNTENEDLMYSRKNIIAGLHLEQEMFLAPKVIKK